MFFGRIIRRGVGEHRHDWKTKRNYAEWWKVVSWTNRVLRMYPEHQRPRICGEKLTPPPYGKAHNDDSD